MAATTTGSPPPRLAVQAFWLTASKLIAAALNICLPILLVRLMPQTEYGVLKEALLFVTTAASVAMFGVGMSAYYYMPRYPERGGQVALNILIYNFIAGWIPLLIIVFYPAILRSLFRTDALEPLAWLLGLLVLLTLSGSLVQQIPTALQDVRYSTGFIVGTQITRVLLLAAAALIYGTVKSIIVASVLNQILAVVLLWWYLDGKFSRFWAHFDWQFFKEQLAYALPYGAFGMIWVIQKDLDNYFVSASLGPTAYAIYAVGWVEVPLLTLAVESVASVMNVRVSSLEKENRKADIRYVTAAATNRLAALQFPLFAMLFVAGRDLIVLLYTKTYEASAPIFLVSITLLPLAVLLLDPIVRAYKNLRRYLLTVRICVFIALFCVLGPVIRHFGMIGAAVTSVTAQVIERIFIAWGAARAVEARPRHIRLYADLFKVMGITILAGFIAYTIRNLIPPALLIPRILVVGLCVSAVYLPSMLLLRLPGWEMLTKERLAWLLRNALGRLRNTV
ncbi:MAG TPA: lipopolysaccharide biosynthesis protein [Alloacidobacterium sp.]|nr:lipopolysaccharide biosynthesis protein [Alloacidobacterium sp.]